MKEKIENICFRIEKKGYDYLSAHKIIKTRPLKDLQGSLGKTFFGSPVIDAYTGNKRIYELLNGDKPCMIARIGTVEMGVMMAYMDKKVGLIKGITGERTRLLCNNAGFFPDEERYTERFGEEYISATRQIDLIGVFGSHGEDLLLHRYAPKAEIMQKAALGSYYFDNPWSEALANKKVLVINPFAKTISKQYLKREELFDNPKVLPEFILLTYKSLQTIGTNTEGFDSWFSALEYMKKEISKIDFDVAIIGCGAYGFLLAAYIKQLEKKSIILGGATQILFGIKGARWDNSSTTAQYYKDSWVRPDISERPSGAEKVENGCYW